MNQTRLLTAFFDSMADAQRAVDRLVQIGIGRDQIEMTAGADAGSSTTAAAPDYEQMGFWASLKSLFMPDEDRYAYAEGLRRGGYLVSLHPTDAQHDRAVSILEEEGTVDMDEREQSWRGEGWSGYERDSGDMASAAGFGDSAGAMGGVTPAGTTTSGMGDVAGFTGSGTTTGMGAPATPGSFTSAARSTPGAVERGASLRPQAERTSVGSPGAVRDSAVAGSAAGRGSANAGGVTGGTTGASGMGTSGGFRDTATPPATTGMGGNDALTGSSFRDTASAGMRSGEAGRGSMQRDNDQTIPVVEEQLRVGKREMGGGRVRVRSYVVETPVQQQVDLTNERVSVDRRPVDKPVSGTAAAFQDRTIEATERKEAPVVSKEARVTEEVRLRKDAETRRETVDDKVRSTKVEVDDQRNLGAARGPGRP